MPRQKGFKHSKKTKQKIGLANKGNTPFLNKEHSNKTKLKISNSLKGNIPWNKGKKNSQRSGKKHHNWKGDNAGFDAMHSWVIRRKGKPKICIDCGATCKERRLEWSNTDHKYRRVLKDYQARCVPCHRKHDKKIIKARS